MPNELITTAQELWSADLYTNYQDHGYKLAAWCNRGGDVRGTRLHFPKLAPLTGSGQAINAVGAMLTFTDGTHSTVFVDMVDRHATPLALRMEDLQKVVSNADYRGGYAMNQLSQLGRYADDQIIAAFTAGKNSTILGPGSTVSLTIDHLSALREAFDKAEAPDDGGRVCLVSPETWSQLIKFKEFSNADYIGFENLPWASGMTGKLWQSINWVTYTRTPVTGTVASCMAWHRNNMGHGVNMAPWTTISQETLLGGQYAVVSGQSMGALVIDNEAVFEFAVDHNVAPTV